MPTVTERRAKGARRRARTTVPTAYERHLMNRLGCGYSRETWQQMRRAGGPTKWFEKQLRPNRVKENALATGIARTWYPDLKESPVRMWERNTGGNKMGWQYALDLGNQSMLRRIHSNRQVLETMVDFWSNHLHVPTAHDTAWVHRIDYDRMIRAHALGRFDDLLVAATLHPAMLLFLDNWRSTRQSPNENHGRELLELHTVGRTSGYTEQMVKDSARILSGFTLDAFGTWAPSYDPGRHATGPVQVLGFRHANAAADGADVARAYLRYLARHPATARTIARKLAIRFVSDTPSVALVNRLAKAYRDSGTDIAATLRVLVASKEFRTSAGRKVRTPIEDLVATCRVLRIRPLKPTNDDSFARVLSWVHGSTELYQWPRPDGPPETGAEWSSVTRMLSSYRMHWNLAAGWWPSVRVTRPAQKAWLPGRRVRMDVYVDHLSRVLLGRPATAAVFTAAAQATGHRLTESVDADHPLVTWKFVRLVGVLLDSPTHMSR